jgi:hypothetical protein
MGSLSPTALNYPGQRGRHAKNFIKIYLFGWWIDKSMENYAIMPSLKGSASRTEILENFHWAERS